MRPSASPSSRSTRLSVSLSNSRTPEKSTCAIAGRSSTSTTSTPLSTSRRTSRKNPVANSARSAACAFSSVIVSPTLTGR